MVRFLSRWIRSALLGWALLPAALFAGPVPEYDLKAAFVYNFALFTDWPADTHFEGDTLNICINAASALRPALANLQEKVVRRRRIAVRAMPGIENVRACHVLVLDAGDRERWPALHAALGSAPILTIADDPEIGAGGSIIAFALEGGRAVFHIDTRAAHDARLVLSSKLLRLARSVQ